jgi:hypothetical protein
MRKAFIYIIILFSCDVRAACDVAKVEQTPLSRFVLSAGEVQDKKTGLVWYRCSLGQIWDGAQCKGEPILFSIDEALLILKNSGGFWRIPNIKELRSIVETMCKNPSINMEVFPGVGVSGVVPYMTSDNMVTTSITGSSGLWTVNFNNGSATVGAGKAYVRPVRNLSN